MKTAALLLLASACTAVAGGLPPLTSCLPETEDPSLLWSFDVETSSIWNVGHNTSIDYAILPQIISLRTPAHARLSLGASELTLRARASLLIEPIVRGPETGYLGFSFSPVVELWTPSKRTAFYVSAGGGAGWVDSQDGVEGAQGQDFTLNWFAETGVRFYLRPDLAFSAGAFFQHMSNGGATDPNPGIDAVGPRLGLTWHF